MPTHPTLSLLPAKAHLVIAQRDWQTAQQRLTTHPHDWPMHVQLSEAAIRIAYWQWQVQHGCNPT